VSQATVCKVRKDDSGHDAGRSERERKHGFPQHKLELAAFTIAAIYKERWQIDLFFKALKQSIKIRTLPDATPSLAGQY